MPQSLNIKIRGLYTFPNDFSSVPEGALAVADNIVVDRDSIAEPRRGLNYLSSAAGRADVAAGDIFQKIFFYKDTLVAHVKNADGKYVLKYFDVATGWVDIYSAPVKSGAMGAGGVFVGANLININSHGFYTGMLVNISKSGGSYPTNVSSSDFYVIVFDVNNFYLSASYANCWIPTPVVITGTGTLGDTITFTPKLYYPAPTYVKMQSIQQNQNLYLTTFSEVIKMDDYLSIPVPIGCPQGLDLGAASATAIVAPVWLENNYYVNYRVVWGRKDKNGILSLGEPSGSYTYQNTSGAKAPAYLNMPVPPTALVGDIYQIYRSRSSATIPNDELQQCFEGIITPAERYVRYITISDVTDDTLLGSALYTNETQEGSLLANSLPPVAKDIALYRDCLFYLNIVEQHYFLLTLKAGIADTNTITINGLTLTAKTSPSGAQQFLIVPSVGGSVAKGVEATAKGLVRCINVNNMYNSLGIYATYASATDDFPGKILLRKTSSGGSAFTVVSSAGCWIPSILTTQSSVSDTSENGIACSKPLQPSAVPLAYRWFAGSKDSKILRGIALRDSLFILKEDGVWRLYGSDPSNWQIALLDATANIVCPDSAIVMNNQIFALTTQGVVTISENGVTIISRPIESDLLDLLAINPTVFKNESFSVAYESQRAYYVFIPTTATDTGPTQYYRYNTITNNWTRGTLAKTCGGVNPYDDKLYLGDSASAWLDQERKSLTSWDYADYVNTYAISQVSGTVVTIASASTLVSGQTIYQAPSYGVKTCSTTTDVAFATGIFTKTAHTFVTGLKVALSINSGSLPAGLSATDYWVIKVNNDSFKLADTYALAIAGTTTVFTDNGTTGKVLTFTPNTSPIWGEIATVGATTVTMAYPTQFIYANADVSDPIATQIKWVPCTFANPGINKQVRETTIMFLSDFYGAAEVSFETDISPQIEIEDVAGLMAAPFGYFPWGSAPWGGYAPRRKPLRVGVPRIHQRCSFIVVGFEHAHCFSPWAIQGISLIGNNISEKVWMEGSTV